MAERIAVLEERPFWKRALGFVIWAAVIIACVIGGRWGYRQWRASQLIPRLAAIQDVPDDAVLGGLVNLRCAAADEALSLYAADSVLRCYSPRRRFFLWTVPPKVDGTQLLMYYRVAPGSEEAILPWSTSWRGNGVSYRSVGITGLALEGEKLSVRFRLSKELSATTGLAVDAKYSSEFTLDEFAKLMDNCELDVRKEGLSHPDLGWPANLLKRAGALTPAAHDKLRGK
jgi:hypothetical protein